MSTAVSPTLSPIVLPKRKEVTDLVIPTILASIGVLTAFAITFAVKETFDTLVTTKNKLYRVTLAWLYAALVFSIALALIYTHQDEETTIVTETRKFI